MKTVRHYSESEWLKWRRGGISASDAAIIAGEIKKPSRVDLWLQKLGKQPEQESNEAMKFGKAMEGAIAAMYAYRTGKRVVDMQICGEAEGTPFPMRATLDAFDKDGTALEFKAVSIGGARYWPEDGDAENIPARVLYQVQHQMRVAGAEKVIVVAAIPLELRLYEVHRREEIIGPLMDLEQQFWGYVQEQLYPGDCYDEDAEAFIRAMGIRDRRVGLSDEVAKAVDLYDAVGSDLRELEAQKRRLKDRILSAMGGNRYGELPDGRIVDCNVIEVRERTQTVKAHTQVRLTVKRPENGG